MINDLNRFKMIIILFLIIISLSCDEIKKDSESGLTGKIRVPEDFETIQDAINAASNEGATVIINEGVYKGEGNTDLNINGKHIQIVSKYNDPNRVVIDCESKSRAITFEGDENRRTIIKNITIKNGYSSNNGAGMVIRGMPVISNCIFINNVSELAGGAVACVQGSMPIFQNCLFYHNRSEGSALFEGGGAIYCDRSEPTFINCTITKNTANLGGGVFSFYKSTPTLINSIIYGNVALNSGNEVYQYKGGTASGKMTLINCDVSNTVGDIESINLETENCIYVDPGFTDSNNMNFSLSETSICVNGGDNLYIGYENYWDVYGLPRIADLTVDIGAYEYNNPDFVANFSIETTVGEDSIEVNFTNESIGNPDSWAWDFDNDGNDDSTEINPIHTYTETGLYTVTLKITKGAETFSSTYKYLISFVKGDEVFVPDDFNNIQEAIIAVEDGDTITVKDGTYTGFWNRNIDLMGKAIQVNSVNGAENTIINCEDKGRGFIISTHERKESIINGFTVHNGYTEFNGGGFYICDSNPIITNCIIKNCYAGETGGGFFIHKSDSEIDNCLITDNSSNNGAGVYVISSSCSIRNCEIVENTAVSYGGGVNVLNLNMLIENTVVKGNIAGYGAGLFINNTSIKVNNCLVVENEAFFDGGGVFLEGKSCLPKVQNCTLSQNIAKQGGGVFIFNRAAPIFKNSIIWSNKADAGKQIYASISGDGTGSIILNNCVYSMTFNDIYDLHDKLSANKDSILIDPKFSSIGDDDYYVAVNSPCIDAGTGLAVDFVFLENRSIVEDMSEDNDATDIGYHYEILTK